MSEQTATEIVRRDVGPGSAALARTSEDWELGIPVERLVARVEKIKEVQAKVMKADHHFGVIPGTGGKPTLLKPGAEILCLAFQLAPEFKMVETSDGDHLECVVTCVLTHAPTGTLVGSGIGSCSTRESKYAYRKGERVCPKCGKAAIIKGKEEYGGGWLCFAKKDGCGAKFGDKDATIVGQQTGRVANPDLPDLYNTVRKMACKRAHVAATLFVTCASEIFTQDVEDMRGGGDSGDDDGGRWGDDQPQQQQPPRGQQTARGTGPARANQPQGRPAAKPSEGFEKMTKLIAQTKSIQELEELVPELSCLRDEQAITVQEYSQLRAAYSARVKGLDGESRASA